MAVFFPLVRRIELVFTLAVVVEATGTLSTADTRIRWSVLGDVSELTDHLARWLLIVC